MILLCGYGKVFALNPKLLLFRVASIAAAVRFHRKHRYQAGDSLKYYIRFFAMVPLAKHF